MNGESGDVLHNSEALSHEGSVTGWLSDLQDGSDEAAEHLWERYFQQLVDLANRRLGTIPRAASDSEDIALSAFHSLCRGAARGRFDRLGSRDDLWHLLLHITRQKVAAQVRRGTAQKRGGGLAGRAGPDGSQVSLEQVMTSEPTPEALTLVDEWYQHLLNRLRDDSVRKVAVWRMEGYSNDEIASKLDCTTRSVERKLKLIRETWTRELEGD